MTAAPTAGAASPPGTDGHGINGSRGFRPVRRLQARLVAATPAGRWGQVTALHHGLTHACSAKALAVRRVTEHQGQRPPGIERVVWDRPAKTLAAVYTLKPRGDRAQPLRRVSIANSHGKKRPLGRATMEERARQRRSRCAVDPLAETTGDRNSSGCRRERSTAEASEPCLPG